MNWAGGGPLWVTARGGEAPETCRFPGLTGRSAGLEPDSANPNPSGAAPWRPQRPETPMVLRASWYGYGSRDQSYSAAYLIGLQPRSNPFSQD
jgi:hypothetical protein